MLPTALINSTVVVILSLLVLMVMIYVYLIIEQLWMQKAFQRHNPCLLFIPIYPLTHRPFLRLAEPQYVAMQAIRRGEVPLQNTTVSNGKAGGGTLLASPLSSRDADRLEELFFGGDPAPSHEYHSTSVMLDGFLESSRHGHRRESAAPTSGNSNHGGKIRAISSFWERIVGKKSGKKSAPVAPDSTATSAGAVVFGLSLPLKLAREPSQHLQLQLKKKHVSVTTSKQAATLPPLAGSSPRLVVKNSASAATAAASLPQPRKDAEQRRQNVETVPGSSLAGGFPPNPGEAGGLSVQQFIRAQQAASVGAAYASKGRGHRGAQRVAHLIASGQLASHESTLAEGHRYIRKIVPHLTPVCPSPELLEQLSMVQFLRPQYGVLSLSSEILAENVFMWHHGTRIPLFPRRETSDLSEHPPPQGPRSPLPGHPMLLGEHSSEGQPTLGLNYGTSSPSANEAAREFLAASAIARSHRGDQHEVFSSLGTTLRYHESASAEGDSGRTLTPSRKKDDHDHTPHTRSGSIPPPPSHACQEMVGSGSNPTPSAYDTRVAYIIGADRNSLLRSATVDATRTFVYGTVNTLLFYDDDDRLRTLRRHMVRQDVYARSQLRLAAHNHRANGQLSPLSLSLSAAISSRGGSHLPRHRVSSWRSKTSPMDSSVSVRRRKRPPPDRRVKKRDDPPETDYSNEVATDYCERLPRYALPCGGSGPTDASQEFLMKRSTVTGSNCSLHSDAFAPKDRGADGGDQSRSCQPNSVTEMEESTFLTILSTIGSPLHSSDNEDPTTALPAATCHPPKNNTAPQVVSLSSIDLETNISASPQMERSDFPSLAMPTAKHSARCTTSTPSPSAQPDTTPRNATASHHDPVAADLVPEEHKYGAVVTDLASPESAISTLPDPAQENTVLTSQPSNLPETEGSNVLSWHEVNVGAKDTRTTNDTDEGDRAEPFERDTFYAAGKLSLPGQVLVVHSVGAVSENKVKDDADSHLLGMGAGDISSPLQPWNGVSRRRGCDASQPVAWEGLRILPKPDAVEVSDLALDTLRNRLREFADTDDDDDSTDVDLSDGLEDIRWSAGKKSQHARPHLSRRQRHKRRRQLIRRVLANPSGADLPVAVAILFFVPPPPHPNARTCHSPTTPDSRTTAVEMRPPTTHLCGQCPENEEDGETRSCCITMIYGANPVTIMNCVNQAKEEAFETPSIGSESSANWVGHCTRSSRSSFTYSVNGVFAESLTNTMPLSPTHFPHDRSSLIAQDDLCLLHNSHHLRHNTMESLRDSEVGGDVFSEKLYEAHSGIVSEGGAADSVSHLTFGHSTLPGLQTTPTSVKQTCWSGEEGDCSSQSRKAPATHAAPVPSVWRAHAPTDSIHISIHSEPPVDDPTEHNGNQLGADRDILAPVWDTVTYPKGLSVSMKLQYIRIGESIYAITEVCDRTFIQYRERRLARQKPWETEHLDRANNGNSAEATTRDLSLDSSRDVFKVLSNAQQCRGSSSSLEDQQGQQRATPQRLSRRATVSNLMFGDLTYSFPSTLAAEAGPDGQRELVHMCYRCLTAEATTIFLPCGHFATCMQCGGSLRHCCVCETTILATIVLSR